MNKATSGLIITVDEDSDNEEWHYTVTTMPTIIEKPTNFLLAHEYLISTPNIFLVPLPLDAILSDSPNIVETHLYDWSCFKAFRPVCYGGLVSIMPPRMLLLYISGLVLKLNPWLQDSQLWSCSVSLRSQGFFCIPSLCEGRNGMSADDTDIPLFQHSPSGAIDELIIQSFLASASDSYSHALVLSTSFPHAGDWIHAFHLALSIFT